MAHARSSALRHLHADLREILLVALHFQVPANLLQAIAEREATDEGAIRTVRSIGERLARPLRAGMRTIEALAQVTNFPPEVIQQIVARGNEIYHGEQPPPARTGEIELRRAPNGHFFARVAVNGIPMLMMVDTGASRVSLTAADAEAAGILLSPTDFTVPIQTANGITYAAEVVLDALYVEGRRLGPTAAFVLPSGGDSLLGNSALIQLGRMEVDGDRLRIEAR